MDKITTQERLLILLELCVAFPLLILVALTYHRKP